MLNLFPVLTLSSVVIVRKSIDDPLIYRNQKYREGVGSKYVALPFRGIFYPMDMEYPFVFFPHAKWIDGSNNFNHAGSGVACVVERLKVSNHWEWATIHLVASTKYTIGAPISTIDFGLLRQTFIGDFSTYMSHHVKHGTYTIQLIVRGVNNTIWESFPDQGDGYQSTRQWSVFIVKDRRSNNSSKGVSSHMNTKSSVDVSSDFN